MSGKDQCYTHDPSVAERRQRTNKRGGKSGGRGRPKVRVDEVYKLADEQIQKLSDRQVDPKRSAVMAQWGQLKIRAIETERKLVEISELEAEVEQIKKLYEQTRAAHDGDATYGTGVWSG